MSTPSVTIGMPVFNGERYVAEALDSLLEQTFENFELIISDNASSDQTEEICRAFASKDARIRYYRRDVNCGAAANYNSVFELSSAPYFKWAAHDDVCAPAYLERCVEVLDQHPTQPVLVYGRTVLIDEFGEVIRDYDDKLDLRLSRPDERLRYLLRRLVLCNALVGVIRSRALHATRLIGAYGASDVVLLAELVLQGEFWEIPDRLFFRRVARGESKEGRETPSHKQADASSQKIATWFAPRNEGRITLPRVRRFVEHMRAIRRSPLSWRQRMSCYNVLLRERFLARQQWRALGGECKQALRQGIPLSIPPKRRSGRGCGEAVGSEGASGESNG